MTDIAIINIISKFRIQGEITSARPFGSGNINDTYRVNTNTGNNYLLQKINHYVFKDVPGLMNNLVKVTHHLKQKLSVIPGSDPAKETLTLIENNDNGFYIKDEVGDYWRVFLFLKNTKSYNEVSTAKQAFEGGKAFGRFQALLADMDPGAIIDTIPDFHNIEFRLLNLKKAIAANRANRASNVIPEIEFAEQRGVQMSKILQLGREGTLPQRIIHNDTKFNNVLLDENDKAQCVIDLDTVMPGYVAYDFGDAVRTIINTAPEDEPDLSLIHLNIPLFTAYVDGYLQQTVGFLTEAEINSLIEGALLLPFMQGVRFLTDYIDGDIYFKIRSPLHNLERVKAQFKLVKQLEEAKGILNNIILKVWHNYKKA